MTNFLSFTVLGLFTGAAYAIAASGLVLTYSTTRIFNLAHGAMGMFLAFVFWDVSQRQGLPTWLSVVIVLGVVAPVLGILIYLGPLRNFAEAPISVSLVATLGVFVGLIGVTQAIWPPTSRIAPPFFGIDGFQLGKIFITYHQVLTIALSGVVALVLYLLLNKSRTGAAMRGAVDNPELLKLYGGRPDLISTLAWAIASSLAGLAGILLTPELGMDYYQLTFLVVNAYAAAMFGRLKNLPMTFVGALMLGILQAYSVGYLPAFELAGGFRAAIPTLFLFVILVVMPQAPLRVGQIKGLKAPRVPSQPRTLAWSAAFLVVAAVIIPGLSRGDALLVGTAMVYAIVMLSLVLLTGYAGYVSLAQLTFAGVGAVAYCKLEDPTFTSVLIAALVTAGVGALVALTVLRLTGLYLALATMAFGLLMDHLVFRSDYAFGATGILTASRPSLMGLGLESDWLWAFVLTVIFVVSAVLLLMVRRSRLGRVLIAIRDSPAACGTLGLNMNWLRVAVFAASAGVAGMAGALFAGQRGSISTPNFVLFASLPLILVAVAWGVTSITGALIGGFFLMLMPVLSSKTEWGGALVFIIIGFGATLLAREPNGLASMGFEAARKLRNRFAKHRSGASGDLPGPAAPDHSPADATPLEVSHAHA